MAKSSEDIQKQISSLKSEIEGWEQKISSGKLPRGAIDIAMETIRRRKHEIEYLQEELNNVNERR